MLCKMTLGTPRVGDSVTFSIHHRVESLSLTASRQPHDGINKKKRGEEEVVEEEERTRKTADKATSLCCHLAPCNERRG